MSKITILLKGILAFSLLMSLGCEFSAKPSFRNECFPLVKTYFRMPLTKQITEFGSYYLETQYKIFICGNQVIHPPAIYLVAPFAQDGYAAVEFLKMKLSQATDDLTIRDIILVFTEMNRRHTYEVAENKELVQLMINRVEKMQDEDWKRMTQENLNEIAKNQP